MTEKEITKNIKRQIRIHFWLALLGCFAGITVLSLAVWGVYKYSSLPRRMPAKAEELIEKIDDLRVGGNGRSELESMKNAYEGLSGKGRRMVSEKRYDRLLEAITLEKKLEEKGKHLTVLDKSKNNCDLEFYPDTEMALKRCGGRIAFMGQTELRGETTERVFDHLMSENNSFTIEARINPNNWGYADGDFNMIASKGDNCTAFRISSQSVYFYLKNTEQEWKGVSLKLTKEQMNSWIRVAAVYNGKDISVYLEGSGMKTREDVGAVTASAYPLGLGYCPETRRSSVLGIESFHVYSRALTEKELDQESLRPDGEDVVVWYDFYDYTCPGLDTEIRGIRAITDAVELEKGKNVQLYVEPVPYYAKQDIIYRTNDQAAAVVLESGVLYGLSAEKTTVTAEAEGTDFSMEIPVAIREPGGSFQALLSWMVQKMFWIDAVLFTICLFCILAVQRRKAISCLTKLSEAVYFIGKDSREPELPAILSSTQEVIQEVEESLRQKDHAASEAEKRKNDMVVYLAHDLKTPIASLIGYLTLLRDEKQISPETYQHYIEIALNNSERLNDLVNEFFEIARFNLSHLTLNKVEICLTWMLEQMVADFGPMLKQKGLTCRIEAEDDIFLQCDPDKVERIFDNLLRNAINYSFCDTEILITVKMEEYVMVTCTNCGETIPQEKLDRIFEQFYRLDSARSSHTGGSGLGLAIAKQLVELHHGKIWAESREGQICFTVLLPGKENP